MCVERESMYMFILLYYYGWHTIILRTVNIISFISVMLGNKKRHAKGICPFENICIQIAFWRFLQLFKIHETKQIVNVIGSGKCLWYTSIKYWVIVWSVPWWYCLYKNLQYNFMKNVFSNLWNYAFSFVIFFSICPFISSK